MISLELSQDLKFISGLKSHSDFKSLSYFFQILGDLMENITPSQTSYTTNTNKPEVFGEEFEKPEVLGMLVEKIWPFS